MANKTVAEDIFCLYFSWTLYILWFYCQNQTCCPCLSVSKHTKKNNWAKYRQHEMLVCFNPHYVLLVTLKLFQLHPAQSSICFLSFPLQQKLCMQTGVMANPCNWVRREADVAHVGGRSGLCCSTMSQQRDLCMCSLWLAKTGSRLSESKNRTAVVSSHTNHSSPDN